MLIIPLEEQLEDNVSQSLSFSLSIPIFNGWQANSLIARAKIGVLQSQYNLQQAENLLRKQIEQANADALAAHKKYLQVRSRFKRFQNHLDIQKKNTM